MYTIIMNICNQYLSVSCSLLFQLAPASWEEKCPSHLFLSLLLPSPFVHQPWCTERGREDCTGEPS